jgi:predicted ATPase
MLLLSPIFLSKKGVSMKKYMLTGMPGCGKTALIQALDRQGYKVVEEAITDVIAYEHAQGNVTPWTDTCFIDQIIFLQKQRQLQGGKIAAPVQFYDRSPVCIYALALYLGFAPSALLLKEIERIQKQQIYQNQVFFIEHLGFCTPTQARTLSFEEAVSFGALHAEIYTQFGYECVAIPAASVHERMTLLLAHL